MGRRKKYFDDTEINDLFHEWLEMRRKMRKPATDYAIELAISHLREKSNNMRLMAIEMLKESIYKNWLDFYPKNMVGKQYSYDEVCHLVTKEGFSMEKFKKIAGTKYYVKMP